MEKLILLISLCFLSMNFISCSSDTATTSTASSSGDVTSLDGAPGATSPVTTAYSASRGARSISNRAEDSVTTGKLLSSISQTLFSNATNPSRLSCDVLSSLKDTYSKAVQPDLIKCYVGKMIANATAVGLTATDVNTDGTRYNYWSITENDRPGSVKFKYKLTDGKLAEFEMFECMGGTAYTDGQNGSYFKLLIDGTSQTITSKNIGTWTSGSDGGTYAEDFDVAGTLSNGQYTAKTMTNIYKHTSTGDYAGTSYGKTIIAEKSDIFEVNAYNYNDGTGSWGNMAFANVSEVTSYGHVQLLNTTPGTMSTLSAGSGTIKSIVSEKNLTSSAAVTTAEASACTESSYTQNGGGCYVTSETSVEAFNGDSLAQVSPATDGYHYSVVNAASPNTTQSDPTIAFESTETWNCTDIAEGDDTTMKTLEITAAVQAEMATCDAKYTFSAEDGHISCWQLESRD